MLLASILAKISGTVAALVFLRMRELEALVSLFRSKRISIDATSHSVCVSVWQIVEISQPLQNSAAYISALCYTTTSVVSTTITIVV